MTYGSGFNLFFKDNKEKSNQEKIEILRQYSTGDMLTLLRNIEESPREYDEEIIKGVYDCLFDKGIMCI
ncbi:hypothetical protein [Clostridium polynesiense]|uniref:hypothetical protein n=1 Tax=Clostridium polynesiense TaxID=1325933 RepID=UPI00058C331C|nr:hypothetical protein [Clostridium polynesiense]